MTQITSWTVELEGQQFDLEDFPFWMKGSDVSVVRQGDLFLLLIPSHLVGTSPEPVHPFVLAHVERLNGIGRLLNPSFRPIAASNRTHGINAAGKVVSTAIQISGAEMRVKASALQMSVNGVPQPDSREGAARPLLRAAERSQRANDALAILGRPNLTWSELYLLFELVEAEVGARMFQLGWVGEAESKLFTRTANSYAALGSAGRHGKDRGQPPSSPMLQSTAVGLVRELVLGWLNQLGHEHSSQDAG